MIRNDAFMWVIDFDYTICISVTDEDPEIRIRFVFLPFLF
jgi:hypothetical protein